MVQKTKAAAKHQQVDRDPEARNDQILGDIERITNPEFEALAGKPTNPAFPKARLEANKNAPDLSAGNKVNVPDNKPGLNNQGPKGP